MSGENSKFFSDKILDATLSVPGDTPTVRDIVDMHRKNTPPPTFDALTAEFLAQPPPGPEASPLMRALYGALVGYAITRDPALIGLEPTVPNTPPPVQEW